MPASSHLLLPRLRPAAASRRLAAWLALLALLVAAVVPTLSRLALPDGTDPWNALCQARGSTPSDSRGPHEMGDACALCTLAHTTPVLPGGEPSPVAAMAYAPPRAAPPVIVRARLAQARAPSARAPPVVA